MISQHILHPLTPMYLPNLSILSTQQGEAGPRTMLKCCWKMDWYQWSRTHPPPSQDKTPDLILPRYLLKDGQISVDTETAAISTERANYCIRFLIFWDFLIVGHSMWCCDAFLGWLYRKFFARKCEFKCLKRNLCNGWGGYVMNAGLRNQSVS